MEDGGCLREYGGWSLGLLCGRQYGAGRLLGTGDFGRAFGARTIWVVSRRYKRARLARWFSERMSS